MFRRQLIAAAGCAAALSLGLSGAAFAEDWVEPFPVKGKPTIVDFGAEWCASCPEMAQLMNAMQKEYGEKVTFITIDIDKYRGIENKYLIEEMPSQIFYDHTGEPVWFHRGAVDADALRERADILLEAQQRAKEGKGPDEP